MVLKKKHGAVRFNFQRVWRWLKMNEDEWSIYKHDLPTVDRLRTEASCHHLAGQWIRGELVGIAQLQRTPMAQNLCYPRMQHIHHTSSLEAPTRILIIVEMFCFCLFYFFWHLRRLKADERYRSHNLAKSTGTETSSIKKAHWSFCVRARYQGGQDMNHTRMRHDLFYMNMK